MSLRRLLLMLVLLTSIGIQVFGLSAAQESTQEGCDVQALLAHQQEHAARLDDLAEMLETDVDHALQELYIAGIAYQALAVQCGFLQVSEAMTEHEDEHNTADADEHGGDDHTEDHDAALERALAVGDPVNGQRLFNTLKTEVGFACATCHRVDTTERLIGPGLLGVGNPDHDPSEHMMDDGDSMAGMDTKDSGHDADSDDHKTDTDTHGHDMDAMMDHMEADPIEYIRTSILDPSAFLVPDFPDNLMPKTYGEVFTDEEINDIIAYLLTLE